MSADAGTLGRRVLALTGLAAPYTLSIVGHTHRYGKTGPRQVTTGNGGAPLTGGANHGFGLVSQRADGAVQVDMIDYQTGMADLAFRFALKADGVRLDRSREERRQGSRRSLLWRSKRGGSDMPYVLEFSTVVTGFRRRKAAFLKNSAVSRTPAKNAA